MPNRQELPRLVFANSKGKVFDHPGLEAVGMKAGEFFRLDPGKFVSLPDSSELFMLPDRLPVGWDGERFVTLEQDPYSHKKEACFAVGAFIPPGYTLTHNTAFHEKSGAAMLPLFAYAACVFYKDKFYAAAIRVDRSFRHDDRFMNAAEILKNIGSFKKLFPKNRLIGHLGNCATVNACANAKNFFLGKHEAPIPTSPVCNAQCQGCISFQPTDRISSTQTRIQFTPTPEEIAELACFHIKHASDSIVSFGQGCEGEPLLAAETIEKAIRKIRRHTSKGSLNINTNASRPQAVARLFDAGLNTIRVSANSVREPYYSRYYQPRGYSFKEVAESVDVAKKSGGFVSINYLSMPGFTDSQEEFKALGDFITQHRVDMIQWRNLNYDPLHYFRDLKLEKGNLKMMGMAEAIGRIQKEFPKVFSGYFNPKKSKFLQILACLIVLVSVLGNVAFGQADLNLAAKDLEVTETKPDNRLRILCPICHRALYVCGVEELIVDGTPNGEYTRQMLATCRPMIEGLPERLFVGGPPIICPYDGGRPIKITGVNAYGHPKGQFFTNRGWQPARRRPR